MIFNGSRVFRATECDDAHGEKYSVELTNGSGERYERSKIRIEITGERVLRTNIPIENACQSSVTAAYYYGITRGGGRGGGAVGSKSSPAISRRSLIALALDEGILLHWKISRGVIPTTG